MIMAKEKQGINKSLLLQLTLVFVITQIIGLLVAQTFIVQDFHATLLNDNPQDPTNALFLIGYILAVTIVLLFIMKHLAQKHLGLLLKVVETLAIFGACWIVLEVFLGDPWGLFLAILLVVARWAVSQNVMIRNVASILTAAGAGAIIGVSLGIFPLLLFVTLLAIYDLIAVFKTKHMVTMAKALVSQNLSFTVAFPTKDHQFELGTGDLVIPLAMTSAVLVKTAGMGLMSSVAVALIAGASLMGLLLTLDYCSRNVGKALPALPLQVLLMLVFSGMLLFVGVL